MAVGIGVVFPRMQVIRFIFKCWGLHYSSGFFLEKNEAFSWAPSEELKINWFSSVFWRSDAVREELQVKVDELSEAKYQERELQQRRRRHHNQITRIPRKQVKTRIINYVNNVSFESNEPALPYCEYTYTVSATVPLM